MGEEKRCPICGEGILQHLGTEGVDEMQGAETPIVETYTCGHSVTEGSLASADADRLEVERRESGEIVPDPEGEAPPE